MTCTWNGNISIEYIATLPRDTFFYNCISEMYLPIGDRLELKYSITQGCTPCDDIWRAFGFNAYQWSNFVWPLPTHTGHSKKCKVYKCLQNPKRKSISWKVLKRLQMSQRIRNKKKCSRNNVTQGTLRATGRNKCLLHSFKLCLQNHTRQ